MRGAQLGRFGALVIICLLTTLACAPNFPGDLAWPSKVRLSVEHDESYDEITVAWSGVWLGFVDTAGVTATVTHDLELPRSALTLTPAGPPPHRRDLATLSVDDGLTPGLWRFEFEITGSEVASGREIALTVVCDQVMPISESYENQTIVPLTVSPSGCTSDSLLRSSTIVTDFSEYAVGQQPHDWSVLSDVVTGIDWTVESGTGLGGAQLEIDQTVDRRLGLTWDSVPEHMDIEMLAKVLTHDVDIGDPAVDGDGVPSPILAARGVIDAVQRAFYFVGLKEGSRLFTGRVVIDQTTGQPIDVAVGGDRDWTTYGADQWIWIRFGVFGPDAADPDSLITVRARAWLDGSPEPNFWPYENTEPDTSGIMAPGRMGILTRNAAADPHIDFIAVSLVGDYAAVPLSMTCPSAVPPWYKCD